MADGGALTEYDEVLAPASVSRLSGQAIELRPGLWEVAMGDAVPAFVMSNGPGAMTNYNFAKVRGATFDSALVTRRPIQASTSQLQEKHDLADIFDVTELGRSTAKVKPSKQVFSLVFYCSGQGCGQHKAADPTNCLRACGGEGACVTGCCKGGERGHCCSVRLVVTITLDAALRHKVLLELRGTHVAAGKVALPPLQSALHMAPSVKRELISKCMSGRDTPRSAVNQLQAPLKRARKEMQAGAEAGTSAPSLYNSRFNPSAARIGSVLAANRSSERGGRARSILGDWGRCNLYVQELLIPNNLVLYFDELAGGQGLVVLGSEESLALGREFGRDAAATDCKHDTTRNCRSMYSSMRVPTPWGWFAVSVWIGPTETMATIELALKAIAQNVPCSDPSCPHTVSERWNGQVYRRWLSCARTFRPYIGTDKHLPTYTAIESAGYAGPVLDPWHGYHAYDQRLLVSQIRETAAVAANGAFRLWTRSDTAAKAMLVRAELIRFTLAQCHTTPPLWSIEQAIDLLQYFDSCWALPGYPPVMD